MHDDWIGMDNEVPLYPKKGNNWTTILWVVGILALLSVVGLACISLLLGAMRFDLSHQSDRADKLLKDKVASATERFHPDAAWKPLSSDLRLPKSCSLGQGYYDCTMYEASWDTNAQYKDGDFTEIASRFGTPYQTVDCSRRDETKVNCSVQVHAGDGVWFGVTVADTGAGTNAIVTVIAHKNGDETR